MTYEVIKMMNFDDFVRNVNEALASGWELAGGIAVCSDTQFVMTYYQALIKR